MWLLLLRQDVKFTRIYVKWLARKSRAARTPIIASRGPIVSLTTHGWRIRTVYLTLESIANGRILPSRIILWLDNEDAFRNRPRSLHRLEERGLEIRLAKNHGPHTKYYPFLESSDAFDKPLVTADDDVLYSKCWLSGLVNSFNADCASISCYRAHRVGIADGKIAPYRSWRACRSMRPSFLNFAAGSSGCIYPPSFLRALRKAGKGFERQCPTADDVWLHANAIRSRFMIRQIQSRPVNFPFLPETQDIALSVSNVGLGMNDVQIKNTYTPTDIETLIASLYSARRQAEYRGRYLVEPNALPDRGQVDVKHSGASIL
jgi:hypothetical protein